MTMVDRQVEADLITRTRALIPDLRARAEEAAELRRVPQENIHLMQEAGSLKTLQATRNGGFGAGMRTHLEVVAALSEGCAATGWVAGVVHAHSWLLSHFPERAQDDAYGANPDAVVAAVIGPRGSALRTADGFELTGFWPFASGNRNSTWLLLGAMVRNSAGEVIDEGDFLVPTADVEQLDDWFVNGLTGTGSSSVKVEHLHIPEHHFLSLPSVIVGKSPGMELHPDDWNVRCAPVPVLALALTGSAIGLARQALRDFPALVRGKTIAYTNDDQYTHPLTHIQAGNAAMLIHEGEQLLFQCADEIDAAGHDGRQLDLMTRARLRLACAQGVHRCLEGVEVLFHASGASGIRIASPLTRAVADLRAINQHGLLNLETNQEMYGRIVLGLEPNTPLI